MTPARHDTLTLTRDLKHSPSRVFAAFASPKARATWTPPDASLNMRFEASDVRPGGRELCVCGPGPAEGVTVENLFHAIEPDARIVSTEVIGMPGAPDAVSLITVVLQGTDSGTHLAITVQITDLGDGAVTPEVEGGWTAALANLEAYLAGDTSG